ncbi:2-C-methyl-D-erythritol 4-phosphate cytidylyltransferase [Nitrosomonas eutropha]|uniref:2-C-methyl-D-erythritol 4-phosphate cytidylyltransferase n=2 Tax=Nitrosomonas eutropha TaxID=916 RepID=ISPD_NITEC|nr:2-C-methyl-D-erythritol 4-phosphate cytidylyltransferase [Nitrosomonas eutropha]Q0AFW3.1 RecName: Full=2-C-methyl-D-erythritol 4-phosphate cytidylyltransferase; AltName: Full=4-diphosphocytidyl-2C-methyl-D-erythritol synthase; AltName: Full=MEP cytidylyltransferase; Short=MCT [Nitrosomonas eutropha C91]ABI59769.1 2-C-methyl-D-erythritol 4-phosphate cytidylyltransferase [Nitrosomonas eutropha C91]PXV83643.1 2-C-methyl-D-erythritol 4-phosphate cytidylyltransferase [Nitrosomonas eutropha]SCX004
MVKFIALITAAGSGSRMGEDIPKQYRPLAGKPMIYHALRTLCGIARISTVCIVLAPEDTEWIRHNWREFAGKIQIFNCGGATRAESVTNGLKALRAANHVQDQDWILVHDAARPGLSTTLVERLLDQLADDEVGGLLAVPLADTLKRADDAGRVICTEPRERLWQAQTPQMFRMKLLLEALEKAPAGITDDASAVEALGLSPKLVVGNAYNFKVTYPQDLKLAELILRERAIT